MKLVSALMPTCHGPEYVERAIRCFEAQTYPCKELVIAKAYERQGPGMFTPPRPLIDYRGHRVERVPPGLSIGELRNVACRVARGSILAHWDDDDVSHPERLARSVAAIDAGASLVGSSLAIYEEPATGRWWRWDGSKLSPKFLLGGTWVYEREWWEDEGPFPDVTTGEDSRHYWAWLPNDNVRRWREEQGSLVDLRDETLYTATMTSQKDTSHPSWEEIK